MCYKIYASFSQKPIIIVKKAKCAPMNPFDTPESLRLQHPTCCSSIEVDEVDFTAPTSLLDLEFHEERD